MSPAQALHILSSNELDLRAEDDLMDLFQQLNFALDASVVDAVRWEYFSHHKLLALCHDPVLKTKLPLAYCSMVQHLVGPHPAKLVADRSLRGLNATLTWRIPDWSTRTERLDSLQVGQTMQCMGSKSKWFLEVHPKGKAKHNTTHLAIFFGKGPGEAADVILRRVEITLVPAKKAQPKVKVWQKMRFHTTGMGYTWADAVPLNRIGLFVADDSLTIIARVPIVHRCSRSSSRIYSQLQLTPTDAPESAPSEVQTVPGAETLDFATIPEMWARLSEKHGDQLAVVDPHHSPSCELTYRELSTEITTFAAGLKSMGLSPGDKVALFSENSARWLVADQGIMLNGAADAVRGASGSAEEMAYIIQHSESSAVVVQDSQTLERLLPVLAAPQNGNGHTNGNGNGSAGPTGLHKQVRFVVVLWGGVSDTCRGALGCPVQTYDNVMASGRQSVHSFRPAAVRRSDLATLVYTSGTTGNPKGVCLTHANLLYQTANFTYFIKPNPGERTLSLLPPWHIYERSCGYFLFSRATCAVYTNIRKFREDLTRYPPHFFVCVPLVLDTLQHKVKLTIKQGSAVKRAIAATLFAASTAFIRARRVLQGVALQFALQGRPLWAYVAAALTAAVLYPIHRLAGLLVYGKIRAALGIQRAVVSGGGSLAAHLDDFYEVLDLPVLNGWGLTETSPVLACRRDVPLKNVRGSVGQAILGTRLRVVDPETLRDLPDGSQGLLLAKGPGVMQGYYNDEMSTAKAFRAGDGWFDTGDLGWRAPAGVSGSNMAGSIVLSGRAKDTIVLSSGENIEPQPLEDLLVCSPYIKHIVLIGQDSRSLGALVVPDADAFEELKTLRGDLSQEDMEAVVRSEITKVSAGRPHHEKVASFVVLPEQLSAEDGTLTRSMKVRRPAIMEKYAAQVKQLQAKLR
ncbi:hypothetical protein WJX72_005702 [[Myrmecia] bisecta]|uniref:MATH domain-containing protein n=1 Tax=[Myrmecia] bisecta TaxID=41462 RepID=A0AAW1PGE3_9CHLO